MSNIITRIEVQKTNKSKFNIFVDDEYYMSISESTYIKVHPKKNTPLEEILEELQSEEFFQTCLNKAIDYLSRRQHGEYELRTKLVQKEYPEDVIEEVMEKVKSLGYINDQKFIQDFVHDKQHFKKWGKQKILSELNRKGLRINHIQIDEELEFDNALSHAEKKIKGLKSTDKNSLYKVKQNLISKGFTFDTVEGVLNEIDIDKIKQNN